MTKTQQRKRTKLFVVFTNEAQPFHAYAYYNVEIRDLPWHKGWKATVGFDLDTLGPVWVLGHSLECAEWIKRDGFRKFLLETATEWGRPPESSQASQESFLEAEKSCLAAVEKDDPELENWFANGGY